MANQIHGLIKTHNEWKFLLRSQQDVKSCQFKLGRGRLSRVLFHIKSSNVMLISHLVNIIIMINMSPMEIFKLFEIGLETIWIEIKKWKSQVQTKKNINRMIWDQAFCFLDVSIYFFSWYFHRKLTRNIDIVKMIHFPFCSTKKEALKVFRQKQNLIYNKLKKKSCLRWFFNLICFSHSERSFHLHNISSLCFSCILNFHLNYFYKWIRFTS